MRRIFREIAEGITNAKIAEGLNRDGIPTPSQLFQARGELGRGKKVAPQWTGDGIYGIASNPSYAGKHSAFNYQKIKGRGLRKAGVTVRFQVRAEDDKVRIALPASVCPALVDEATWQKVNAVMASNKLRASRRNSEPDATLLRGGYARCAYCDRPLTVFRRSSGNGKKSWSYFCPASRPKPGVTPCPGGPYRIAAHLLDLEVVGSLALMRKDSALWGEVLVNAMQRAWGQRTSKEGKLRTVDTTVQRLTAQRDNLLATIKEVSNPSARASLAHDLTR